MKKIILPFAAIITALGLLGGCASKTESGGSEPANGASADTRSNVEPTAAPELEGYNLLWNDEFDGDKLDESIWNKELREPGWTNNELQQYTDSDENIFVQDGKLILKAVKTEKDGKDYYTSGKVNSQSKKPFTYGKVVVSAKAPEGQGLWPPQSIRGLSANKAIEQLTFTKKRVATEVKKLVLSAISNAENNYKLDVDKLVVKEAYVGKALVMKRFHARARGRGAAILKPFSNMTVIVAERVAPASEKKTKPNKTKKEAK